MQMLKIFMFIFNFTRNFIIFKRKKEIKPKKNFNNKRNI